jgi:hypothetical protein
VSPNEAQAAANKLGPRNVEQSRFRRTEEATTRRFGYTPGQYASDDDPRLYLPEAGPQSRIALTYKGSKIAAIEPGQAFDAAEWKQVSQEIEHSILDGTPKTGRDYSFSS